MDILRDVETIVHETIQATLPDAAVKKALDDLPKCSGRLILVAVGKASWQMAAAAYEELGARVDSGVVVTKHGYSRGPIGTLQILEASHPVPDETSYAAADKVLELVTELSEDDFVLFLLSGGGSALFEKPLLSDVETRRLTQELLACGANIVEINTLRKRFSAVKGGRFAKLCAPARVFSIVLSDVLGDPLDMIASGPAYPDASTTEQALAIIKKYDLKLSQRARELLRVETPKELTNVETRVTGSVRELCRAAASACRKLGYRPILLTDRLCCEAREAGSFLGSIVRAHADSNESLAFIAGGETIVRLTGDGLGGRNQELALAAAQEIMDVEDCAVFSIGSDGTDGPTDAAGGVCTGKTAQELNAKGLEIFDVLRKNDSYHALKAVGGLIVTGPTGVNVNDVACALIRRDDKGTN